ncbi:MAG: hypothetical protein C0625_03485 [Arcobacter sp.]|nr:MAG: hypothetical protein C0625_03485 [Arcobacter sp.]
MKIIFTLFLLFISLNALEIELVSKIKEKDFNYLFRKEVISYLNKPLKNIPENISSEDLLTIADFYLENRDIYANSVPKALYFYTLAVKKKNQLARVKIIDLYLKTHENNRAYLYASKILSRLKAVYVNELYKVFDENHQEDYLKELENYIEKKNLPKSSLYYVRKIKEDFYEDTSKKVSKSLINEIYNQSCEVLIAVGNLYHTKLYSDKRAIEFYETCLLKEPNRADAYKELTLLYNRNALEFDKGKSKQVYEKSFQMGDFNGGIALINHYKNVTKDLEAYKLYKEELSKSILGQKVLVKYYQMTKNRDLANRFLTKLALSGDEESMLELVFNGGYTYTYYSREQKELSLQWFNKIMNMDDDKKLKSDLIERLFYGNENGSFIEYKQKIYKSKLVRNNVKYLRELFNKSKNKYPKKALNFLNQAVDLGDKKSIRILSDYYKNGKIVKKDEKKAIKVLKPLVQLKDSDTISYLANIYYTPAENVFTSVSKDEEKALEYMMIPEIQDTTTAISDLAYYYLSYKDYKNAIKYLKKLSIRGYTHESMILANIYEKGLSGNINYKKALGYYFKAAEFKDANALYKIGMYYVEGKSVKVDYKKALDFFFKASAYNKSAVFMIALMHEHGKGIEKNLDEAIYYYLKVANEHPVAAFNLANIYHYNQNKRDFINAKFWYEKSSLPKAKIELERLTKEMAI